MSLRFFRRLYCDRLECRRMLAFDPSANEQYLLESINRMRMFPQHELSVIYTNVATLTSSDPGVTQASQAYGVNAAQLQNEFATLTPVAPLAWSSALSTAATLHSAQMIAYHTQSHQLPGEADIGGRATNAGYTNWQSLGENVYAYAANAFNAHAGFAVDWGNSPPGHRQNIMNSTWRDVGIAAVNHTPANSNDVGPWVVTEDFGSSFGTSNSYLLGAIYRDNNSNSRYDINEGLGSVTVTATPVGGGTSFTTTSMTAGGYQLQLPSGTYTVTATGGGLGATRVVNNVVVASANKKIDFTTATALQPVNRPPVNTLPTAITVAQNSTVTFNAANNLTVSVSDPDALSAPVQVSLGVTAGDLSLASTAGLSFTQGNGTHNAALTFRGTLSAVNSALSGLKFFAPNAASNVTLTMSTNDLGNDGLATPLTDTDTLAISVVPGVTIVGNVATIVGTGGDDNFMFIFDSATRYRFYLNNVLTPSSSFANVTSLVLDGGTGSDVVGIYSAPGVHDRVAMQGNTITWNGPNTTVRSRNMRTNYAFGQSEDTVSIYDTPGNDTFLGLSGYCIEQGTGYFLESIGFGSSYAFSSAGGTDNAQFYDSALNDTYYGLSGYSVMSYPSSMVQTIGFNATYAFSNAGTDTASFYDSAGNDTFYGLSSYSIMSHAGYINESIGFRYNYAYSSNGGVDTALLYDSAGNDTFYGLSGYSILSGTSFFNESIGFKQTYGYSSGGGDQAFLYDSVGNDVFNGNALQSSLSGTGFANNAIGFAQVYAYATAGGTNDTATLDGSKYGDSLSGSATAVTFNTFNASGKSTRLDVQAFDQVFANLSSTLGNDIATLLDSSGNDSFEYSGTTGRMTYASGARIQLSSFDSLTVYGTAGGVNTKKVGAIQSGYALYFNGSWK